MTGVPARPVPAAVADHPLRRVRRRRGLTLAVLAELSGLSASFLSMVENGQRALSRRDHVNALAVALRVCPAEIAPSTLASADEWAPPPARAPAFLAISDEVTMARHRDLAAQLISRATSDGAIAAGVWLRHLAVDPAVSQWLLLDQLISHQAGLPRPR